MATLTTYADVVAELAATADYDGSVTLAKRRRVALRRKLDFAEESDENGRAIKFNFETVQHQIDEVSAFIVANETKTAAEEEADPTVLHADFSTFGQYGGS